MADSSMVYALIGSDRSASSTLDNVAAAADRAGDAVTQAAAVASDGLDATAAAAGEVSSATSAAADDASTFGSRMARVGATVAGFQTAIGDAVNVVSDLAGAMDAARQKEAAHARALAAVEQAGIDAEQAIRDLAQAELDLEQSAIDASQAEADMRQAHLDAGQSAIDAGKAHQDYVKAVKEDGRGSVEAQQALQDLAQAQEDGRQAGIDLTQAQVDLRQAQEDGRQSSNDAAQAHRDAGNAALDLAEAQHELDPGPMGHLARETAAYMPLLTSLVGVMNLAVLAQTALSAETVKNTTAMVANKVGAAATAVAHGAAAAAGGVWTAVQWVLNLALWTCPVTWIVAAVLVLVGVIVLIATKTRWFQNAWNWAWGGIKAGALAVGRWFSGPFVGFFVAVWNWIVGKWNSLVGFVGGIPGRISAASRGMWDGVKNAFRGAINWIIGKWNGLSFRVPSITVPVIGTIGGFTLSTPNIPYLYAGGTVTGSGMAFIADQGPEAVFLPPAASVVPLPRGGGGTGERVSLVLQVQPGRWTHLDRMFLEWLKGAIRDLYAGDVEGALGS
jgi:hypothetical protein